MMTLALPESPAELRALAARLRRQSDPGRTIALALIIRDAITAATVARPDAERGFLDYAAGYLDGLAEATEAAFFAPPADATRH
ncbi:hypothetical protein ACTZWW_03140 [Salinarimonas sp. NSM]|uniref:hypothetical protein n=1 Tax=Salinarimonas sp. NSM TaxID=3458003 RepID=UPI004035789A